MTATNLHLRVLGSALEGRTQRPLHISVLTELLGNSGPVEIVDGKSSGENRAVCAFHKAMAEAEKRGIDWSFVHGVLCIVSGREWELRASDYMDLEYFVTDTQPFHPECMYEVCSAYVECLDSQVMVSLFIQMHAATVGP